MRSLDPRFPTIRPSPGRSSSVLVLSSFLLTRRGGVEMTVLNQGPGILTDVAIAVTGRIHHLGTLTEDWSETVELQPTGESSVHLTFRDPGEIPHSEEFGFDLEPGYNGTFQIVIRNGAVDSSRIDAHAYPE